MIKVKDMRNMRIPKSQNMVPKILDTVENSFGIFRYRFTISGVPFSVKYGTGSEDPIF